MKKLLIGFFIIFCHNSKAIDHNTQKKINWSILIPTLGKRKAVFKKLYNNLTEQISRNNLQNNIEIVVSCDNGEKTVGQKRNELLQASKGEYVCYVDDDDGLHEDYIKMIYKAITTDQPDCVSLVGIITFDGQNPKKFIHSIKYDSWFEKDNIYYRPPNHLNPIRRDIAIRFAFPDKYFGEDSDWSMQICRSGLLKKEAVVEEPYYFYLYSSAK